MRLSLDKYTIRKYQARAHLKNDDFKSKKKKKTETNANNDVLAKWVRVETKCNTKYLFKL